MLHSYNNNNNEKFTYKQKQKNLSYYPQKKVFHSIP